MARETRQVTREITETKRTSHTCDRCGDSLREDMYEISEAEIKFQSGSRYPSGTNAEGIEFDCCVQCFETHVIPAMLSMGFIKYETELSY